jgi:hypothetical protein
MIGGDWAMEDGSSGCSAKRVDIMIRSAKRVHEREVVDMFNKHGHMQKLHWTTDRLNVTILPSPKARLIVRRYVKP